MAQEMAEQPARLRALLARAGDLGERARRVEPAAMHGTTIVARGSSDHAATYGRYLLEAATCKPVSLAAPSLHTLYAIDVDYSGQLVIAVSQSGRTPEIVQTLRRLCAAGGRGLAITNDAHSDLARAGEGLIDLDAGAELAVPATKTVTAQLTAFAILSSALGSTPFSRGELEAVPEWVQAVLDDPGPAAAAAESLLEAPHLLVVARGYLLGAAGEIALKVKETCSLPADSYSAADLRHGPIAAITTGFPVLALSAPGPAHQDICALTDELRARDARVLTISGDAGSDIPLPGNMPEALAPIAAVVRGQQLARELSLRLGHDPDRPSGLTKVTAT
jgi:glutamine---fructose-6-phosphate transaminase (isomerizing)